MKTTASERRESLLTWLRAQKSTNEWTARQIVHLIGYPYDELDHYRERRCFDDLKQLQADGFLNRDGRPARWSVR